MKNFIFIAVLFTAVTVFNNYAYSQSCCKDGSASCSDKNTSSSGSVEAQVLDSIKSETTTELKTETVKCPVSGEEFKRGAGKTISYLGKEYEFCCEGCIAEFKAEPIGYTGGVATCPICNDSDGKSDISMSHAGTKYYFCNEGCKTRFSKDPEKTLENYNKK